MLAAMLVMPSAAIPGLLKVMVWAVLVVFTVWFANVSEVGDKIATGPDAGVPVPESVTD